MVRLPLRCFSIKGDSILSQQGTYYARTNHEVTIEENQSKQQFNWEHIKEFCETLTDEEDSLTREMVAYISDKWSLWTMSIIAEYSRPMRFSRIMENVAGISEKSLTKTLRGLERDDLITREVFAEVPPRVQYAITPLGVEMLNNVAPLWFWVAKSVHRFQGARAAFDGRSV